MSKTATINSVMLIIFSISIIVKIFTSAQLRNQAIHQADNDHSPESRPKSVDGEMRDKSGGQNKQSDIKDYVKKAESQENNGQGNEGDYRLNDGVYEADNSAGDQKVDERAVKNKAGDEFGGDQNRGCVG